MKMIAHGRSWIAFCALFCFCWLAAQPVRGAEAGTSALKIEDRKIAPLDTIVISVMGEEDLCGEHRVQAIGGILFPLLGPVEVIGKTGAEVAQELTEKLEKDYLVKPWVNVTVKDYVMRSINVIGAVAKPGKYEIPGEQEWTIIDAIGAAGGFTERAKEDSIEFIRKGKPQRFSWRELYRTAPKDRLALQAGDLIRVHESFF